MLKGGLNVVCNALQCNQNHITLYLPHKYPACCKTVFTKNFLK